MRSSARRRLKNDFLWRIQKNQYKPILFLVDACMSQKHTWKMNYGEILFQKLFWKQYDIGNLSLLLFEILFSTSKIAYCNTKSIFFHMNHNLFQFWNKITWNGFKNWIFSCSNYFSRSMFSLFLFLFSNENWVRGFCLDLNLTC